MWLAAQTIIHPTPEFLLTPPSPTECLLTNIASLVSHVILLDDQSPSLRDMPYDYSIVMMGA